ncbi:MAG: sensor domain-containing diguanylate cyclase [Rhodospirillales bacterium]|nr:sensor domain-containing diguanylate cyclase [Rhodospirillales bacterium]
MKTPFLLIWVALVALAWPSSGKAEQVDVSSGLRESIGTHVGFLKEGDAPISLDEALKIYAAGHFQAGKRPILTFGIGSKPIWLGFEAINSGDAPLRRRISVETSWLDKIDIYFIRNGRVLERNHTGDAQPFAERPVENRFFVFDHGFEPGTTTVLMRVESPDPIVLPVYVASVEEAQSRNTLEAYSYGFLYGALIALLAYNFILFLGLKNARYLYYSIYLACFVIMNIAYTGHGFQWLWPDSPRWQMWSNLVLMVAYSISGLVFATQFLETKRHFPRLHRLVMGGIFVAGFFTVLSVIAGAHFAMLLVAFIFMFLFSPIMVLLGIVSVFAGIKFAKYFVIASIAAVTGSALTVLVVWGHIPYSIWAYRAVDIGMMIDAVLLALALADQFRVSQEEKNLAEKLARIDPLTGLNNRRAFDESVGQLCDSEKNNNRELSVILMDIDRFKTINDTYGHAFGDDVLIQTAKMIKKTVRGEDVVARWGGEEFIVYLPETNLSEAVFVAERLSENIAKTRLELNGTKINFTASFGVAHRNGESVSLNEVITTADNHLYWAKANGRNRVCSRLLE